VSFADQLLGMSPSKLLHNIATFHVRCSRESTGELFCVSSPEYFFQLEIHDATVSLKRNQYEASRSIAHTKEYFQILFSYRPDRYQLAVMIDGDVGGDDACMTVDTTDIFIPQRLVDWAREVHFIRRQAYQSVQELLSVVVESVHNTQALIRDGNLFPLFWDYPRASGGAKPVPKVEPQSIRIVWGRMQDESVRLGFDFSEEARAGTGKLDGKVVASLRQGGIAKIAIEGKNAHSADLLHGLQHQLPSYMADVRADHGIYLVLWYGLSEEPLGDFTWRLTRARPLPNIAIEAIDLAFPLHPSNKRFQYP
jgi:hypothetical protein